MQRDYRGAGRLTVTYLGNCDQKSAKNAIKSGVDAL